MCHSNLEIDFGDWVNFITGQNGSKFSVASLSKFVMFYVNCIPAKVHAFGKIFSHCRELIYQLTKVDSRFEGCGWFPNTNEPADRLN